MGEFKFGLKAAKRLSNESDNLVIFAMAKIQRIGHDHKAPFWHLLLVGDENQAVTRSENRLPHAQFTSDPQYFDRF